MMVMTFVPFDIFRNVALIVFCYHCFYYRSVAKKDNDWVKKYMIMK